jgi:hypothetical protein
MIPHHLYSLYEVTVAVLCGGLPRVTAAVAVQYRIYRSGGRVYAIDYRCDNGSFWLSTHNCQVPTPTSQNLEFEQQI